jgi:hypothetical protein
MARSKRLGRYTYADYVALEMASPTKHEFFDGEIYAVPGGSEEHSALAVEVLLALGNAVGDQPCRVHTSDRAGRRRGLSRQRHPLSPARCRAAACLDGFDECRGVGSPRPVRL